MRIKIIDKKKRFTKAEKQFYKSLVRDCLKEMGEGKDWDTSFQVVLEKSKRRFISGRGRYFEPLIWIIVPYGILCHNELVHLIKHEVAHTHGIHHKDINQEMMRTCYCTKGEEPYLKYYKESI